MKGMKEGKEEGRKEGEKKDEALSLNLLSVTPHIQCSLSKCHQLYLTNDHKSNGTLVIFPPSPDPKPTFSLV
jgi:hypothetical protein